VTERDPHSGSWDADEFVRWRSLVLDHVVSTFREAVVCSSTSSDGSSLPFWIASSPNSDLPGTDCVMTVGISAVDAPHVPRWGDTSTPRIEYAMIVRPTTSDDVVLPPLVELASAVVERSKAAGSYEVVDLSHGLQTAPRHALVVNGSPLPKGLGRISPGMSFAVFWIIPLVEPEAAYARSRSASRLMLLLRWGGVDIFRYPRTPVPVPSGISYEEFERRCSTSDDLCDDLLSLIEGERDRRRVVTSVASFLDSKDDALLQFAVEAIETLARSEPESFSESQLRAVENSLEVIEHATVSTQVDDALDAVRHAATHATAEL
jgi:hypothetical protein